jgi:hypothetical protein
MRRKRASVLLAMVLAVSACTSKPSTNPNVDPLRNARIQVGITLDSVTAAIQATIALQKEGLISADEDRTILGVLSKVNSGALVINTRLQAITVLTASNKTELSNLLSQVFVALTDANSRGLLGVKNVAAKQRLDAILGSITSALNALKPILGGA